MRVPASRALERERPREPLRLRLLRCAPPMPVRVNGERDGRMSELPLRPHDLGATLERDPGERVPERVEVTLTATLAHARDPSPLERGIEDLRRHVAGREVAALLTLEDEPGVVTAGLAVPRFKHGRGRRRQVDRARLVALSPLLADPVDERP